MAAVDLRERLSTVVPSHTTCIHLVVAPQGRVEGGGVKGYIRKG